MNGDDGVFDVQLMCNILRLEYDFVNKIGEVYLPEGDCTDCQGTISRFQNIDADVKRIYVYSGKALDIVYECPQ